jgi:uncharacterized protein (TIGR02147 family)
LQKSVFDFENYKIYVDETLNIRAQTERGPKSKLAEAMGCRPAYLSQVLNGPQELSPEQGQAANRFFGHTLPESRYFLNLILYSRAGTVDLRDYYKDELKKQKEDRLVLKNRVKANRTLAEADQARYYSSWYFAAIHVLISLEKIKSKEQIADGLGLPLSTVNEALEFLIEIGLIKQKGSTFAQGETSLYLDSKSPFITKHHTNWRMKAIQALDQKDRQRLNYSGVITCSEKDAEKIQEVMIQTVQKVREIVKESKDETLLVYALDLFGLIPQKDFAKK